jgi:lysophospholipase L1-like esterase
MFALLLVACQEDASDPGDPPSDDGGSPSDTGAEVSPPVEPPVTPPGEDPDPDVHNEIPDGYWPADPVRILYLGDSITEGYGASSSELRYVSLLEQNVEWPGWDKIDFETSFPGLGELVDVSEGGATTGELLDLQLPALDGQLSYPVAGETVVVMTIGGNDLQTALIPFSDAEVIVNRALAQFEEIVDYFLDPAKFPDGVFLYATNVYEPTDGVGRSPSCFFGIDFSEDLPQLDRFNGELAQMGRDRGFAVLDLRGHFLGHGYHAEDPTVEGHDPDDPTLWFAPDCIHPNDRGHHEVRRLVHAAVTGEVLTYELP